MVRIGRIVLDEKKVSSVVRANGTGNPLKTTVTMDNGTEHTFDKYAPEAWDYFKSRAAHVAGERFVQHN